MGNVSVAATYLLTLSEAKMWAEKTPQLLRQYMAELPDTHKDVDKETAQLGASYKVTGIGLGAVLAAASFTKYIPGNWKWAARGAGLGSGALGLYVGDKADQVVKTVSYTIPIFKEAVLKYANAIESDTALKQQLADYYVQNITAQETHDRPVESLIAGKAILFGQAISYLDIKSIAQETTHALKCDQNPYIPGCSPSR